MEEPSELLPTYFYRMHMIKKKNVTTPKTVMTSALRNHFKWSGNVRSVAFSAGPSHSTPHYRTAPLHHITSLLLPRPPPFVPGSLMSRGGPISRRHSTPLLILAPPVPPPGTTSLTIRNPSHPSTNLLHLVSSKWQHLPTAPILLFSPKFLFVPRSALWTGRGFMELQQFWWKQWKLWRYITSRKV